MVRPREIKGSRQVCLNLESKVYDDFVKILPRDKSVSEAIREYMEEVIAEQKKEEAPEKLPILNSLVERPLNLRQTLIKAFCYADKTSLSHQIDELTTHDFLKLRENFVHIKRRAGLV